MRRRRVALALVAALSTAACTAIKEGEGGDGPAPPVTDPLPVTEAPPVTETPTDTEAPETTPAPTLADARVQLQEIVTLNQPTAMATRAGDPSIYIAERAGRIRRLDLVVRRDTATFTLDRTPALDISGDVLADGQEQGLLGIAFSTDGNRLYVAYTGGDGDQHLDEFRMSGTTVQRNTRREILVVPDFAENHNGGGLTFGPDGFLYWAMGDGGGANDPQNTGQDPTDLLGSLLRIDPDVTREMREAGQAYAIPDSNPFASGTGGAPEVWAYGLRNPWRFSFDRATGDLWIADVGQGRVEEINFLPAHNGTGAGRAANLGWSLKEGREAFQGREPREDVTLVDPVYQYSHDNGGCAVTGGYVYRGTRIAGLAGAYVFGDYCIGEIQAFVLVDGEAAQGRSLGVNVPQLSSFGQDNDGELWVLSLAGPVYRLGPAG